MSNAAADLRQSSPGRGRHCVSQGGRMCVHAKPAGYNWPLSTPATYIACRRAPRKALPVALPLVAAENINEAEHHGGHPEREPRRQPGGQPERDQADKQVVDEGIRAHEGIGEAMSQPDQPLGQRDMSTKLELLGFTEGVWSRAYGAGACESASGSPGVCRVASVQAAAGL